MKKKIIISSILTAILLMVVYFTNATPYYPPIGGAWMLNGVPCGSATRIVDGTFASHQNLPNGGHRISCWSTPYVCFTISSSLLSTNDGLRKTPNTTDDTPISYYDIEFYYP
ncbi:MAG: hypothetical protein WCR42_15445 [bacterium]